MLPGTFPGGAFVRLILYENKMIRSFQKIRTFVVLSMMGLSGIGVSYAEPKLETNQKFIEELNRKSGPEISDIMSTFQYVLTSLPGEVTVYPTENYYYFSFYVQGIRYAGNLRLATRDRDKGIIHFAYFASANISSDDGDMHYKPLNKQDGVTVKKISDLKYSVSYKDKTVVFKFNDVSHIKPPEGFLQKDEQYMGPVYDESGLQFYLVFNKRLKIFHYILNESVAVPEQLQETEASKRLLIGKRTGFAFYQHHKMPRKILIGIHGSNAAVNNYYDGPFDQLPDNLNKDDTLMKAIEAADPTAKGQLDRFGYLKSGEGRYLIGPYLQYMELSELQPFQECAVKYEKSPEIYDGCFAVQGGGASEGSSGNSQ